MPCFPGANLIWIKEASGQDSDISAGLQDARFTALNSRPDGNRELSIVGRIAGGLLSNVQHFPHRHGCE
jgi:hypothetical protein